MRVRVFLAGLLASLLGLPPEAPPADLEMTVLPGQGEESSAEDIDLEAEAEIAERDGALLPGGTLARREAAWTVLAAARGPGPITFVLSPREEEVLSEYAEAVAAEPGEESVESIAQLLTALPSPERTWIVARWTLSERKPLRLAVARAGSRPLQAIGLLSALRRLARDESPEVQLQARAALRRHGLLPDPPREESAG